MEDEPAGDDGISKPELDLDSVEQVSAIGAQLAAPIHGLTGENGFCEGTSDHRSTLALVEH